MAINIPMATPGLLANPQPYVNLGLLAPQGGQAARLQAPPASMGGQQQMGLGGALGSLGDAFSSMGKANRDQAEFESRQARSAAALRAAEEKAEAEKSETKYYGVLERAFLSDNVTVGSNLVQAAAARATGSPSPSEMNRIPEVTESASGQRPARYPDMPEVIDPYDTPMERPIGGGSLDEWRAAQLAPTAVEMLANAPQEISSREGMPGPVITPVPQIRRYMMGSGDDAQIAAAVGTGASPQAGSDNAFAPLAAQVEALKPGQKDLFRALLKSSIGSRHKEGIMQSFKLLKEWIDPQAIQKAAMPLFGQYEKQGTLYRQALTSYRTLVSNSMLTDASAKVTMVKSFFGILEPGLMVTDSEAESLASGRSIEDNAKAKLWGAFAGKPLTPELRDSMLISAQKSMKARLEAQQDVDKQYRPMFEAFGAEMPTPITPEHLKELDVTHGVANFSHSKVFEGAPIKDILEYEFDDALRSPGEITRWWRSLSREQKQEAANLDYWTYILSELKRAKKQRAEIDQIDQIDQVDGGAS